MKIDVLLKTRGLASDYRWVYCPEYVDDILEGEMSFLVQMMQKSTMKEFLMSEGLRNIYYIHDENGSVLIRGGFSESADKYGRTIYAVEGLACPAEKSRIFWYALPYLIDRLAGAPLLRDRWLAGQTEPGPVQSRQISFSSLTEDCLFMAPDEIGSLWQQLGDHSPCMERLAGDIQTSPEIFNLVYGTRNRSFYPVPLGRYYTPSELDNLAPLTEKPVQTGLNPVVAPKEKQFGLEIQVEKQARRYAAYLIARDMSGEAIAETDAMTFGKDGIVIAQMEKARIAMDKKLNAVGYYRGRGMS